MTGYGDEDDLLEQLAEAERCVESLANILRELYSYAWDESYRDYIEDCFKEWELDL